MCGLAFYVSLKFQHWKGILIILLKLKNLIKKLTIDQWLAIDNEYLDDKRKTDLQGIATFLLIIFLLIIQKYFGQPKNFTSLYGDLVSTFPMPKIWSRLYATFAYFMIYFLIPFLFIKFVLHGRIIDYGFTFRGIRQYIGFYSIIILIVLPLVIITSFSRSFYEHYPFYSDAGNSWADLIIWESIYGFNFIMLEFFFRGFMLFALVRYFGSYSIFIMVIPYVMIHFGKPVAETIGSIIAGVALGTISLRTKTIFGGALIHILIAWSMDILALLQKGHLLF